MATNGYTPLASSIVSSSIWLQPDHVLRVWIYMLAMKDRDDVVRGCVATVAHHCNMTVDRFMSAEKILISPEPPDPTKDPHDDGRRLERIEGGWRVINGKKWREIFRKEARKAYKAVKEQQYRERKRNEQEGAVAAQGAIIKNERETGSH